MLQAFLTIAVPTLVTVLYYLHRMATQEQGPRGPPPGPTGPGFSSGRNAADNGRPRTRPTPRTYSNTSTGPAGGSTVTSRRPDSSTTSRPNRETCLLCSEEGSIVELYPCRHRIICQDCASRIMGWEDRVERVCPRCYGQIQGFLDI